MKHIYFILFLFIIAFGSTQKCTAQFGLFDTVWTINGLAENYSVKLSPNDSLMKIWTWEKPQNVSRYRLYNTYTKELIWDTASFQLGHILSDNKSILSWDSNTVKIRDLFSLEPISSINYVRPNFSNCTQPWGGISEVDTSVYSAGYCGATAIKGISYKVNYKTGQATITSDSLPYFAMTISEDGQYVAGVYYEEKYGSYYENIEVRKISDYSLVFREESKYCDWKPNFTPYSWVSDYHLTLSNNGRFLAFTQRLDDSIKIYDCFTNRLVINEKRGEYFKVFLTFSKIDNKAIIEVGKHISQEYSNLNLSIIDLVDNSKKELDLPDTTLFRIIDSKLLFNNEYLLGTSSYWKKVDDFLFNGDIVLLKLNFDLNSIQEPQKEIKGTLYPNPASDYINVGVQNFEPLQEIEIFDIFGTKVSTPSVLRTDTPQEGNLRIDVSSLPPGVYFLRMGNNKPMKFMVMR